MTTFKASADVVEVNRYSFEIQARTKEEAEQKLRTHLQYYCPYPQNKEIGGITCTDRESAMETQNVKSIEIK